MEKNLNFNINGSKNGIGYHTQKYLTGHFVNNAFFFCNDYVGKGSHAKIGSLVAKPFIKWKDDIEKFTSHSKAGYHRFCINAADNFSNVVNGKMNDVATQLISQRKQQISSQTYYRNYIFFVASKKFLSEVITTVVHSHFKNQQIRMVNFVLYFGLGLILKTTI